METRITFEISGEQYTMFVEGILRKKYYLSKKNKSSVLSDPIQVKVTASTMKESIMYWLECLQTYMRRKVNPVAAVPEIAPEEISVRNLFITLDFFSGVMYGFFNSYNNSSISFLQSSERLEEETSTEILL